MINSLAREQESSLISPKSVVLASEHMYKSQGQIGENMTRNMRAMNIFESTKSNNMS